MRVWTWPRFFAITIGGIPFMIENNASVYRATWFAAFNPDARR
jgi:hypothetical protein